MHPLAADLSALKDSEVEAKLNELTKKYFQAARLGNQDLLTQLSIFVNMYREEMSNRYRKSLKNTNIDGDLDQLINVN
jgi:hypothetical protein